MKEILLVEDGLELVVDAGDVKILKGDDGVLRFWHRCEIIPDPVEGRLRKVVAPRMADHTVVSSEPLTIRPSALCPACGLHGFIRQGKWVSV